MRVMWYVKQNNLHKTYTNMSIEVRPSFAIISEDNCDFTGELGQTAKGRLRC